MNNTVGLKKKKTGSIAKGERLPSTKRNSVHELLLRKLRLSEKKCEYEQRYLEISEKSERAASAQRLTSYEQQNKGKRKDRG